MDEWLSALEAKPVSEQVAALWAASILRDSPVPDAVILLTSLATFEHVSGPMHSVAAVSARTLREALTKAMRPMLN
ncbi:MAG: hypothetical protein U1E52_06550 [Geminicoccaceae bacterium]